MKERKEKRVFMNGLLGPDGKAYEGTVKRSVVALMMLDNGAMQMPVSPYLIDRMTGEKRLDLVLRAPGTARKARKAARQVVSFHPFAVKAKPDARTSLLEGGRAYKVLAMTRDEVMVADDRNRIVWIDRDDVLYVDGQSA